MREILFRGQRITDKKWVEGFLLQGINKGVMLIQFWDDERGYCMEDIIPETVGQFTGLTDKNGVKIFEGDIVYFDYNYIGKIIVLWDILGKWNIQGYVFSKCKIIGNIHENTELLK